MNEIFSKGHKKPAIIIDWKDNLLNAREIMIKNNISRLVIVKNSKPLGILTEKGIDRLIYNKINVPLDKIRVSQDMKGTLIAIDDDKNIIKCANMMLTNKIGSLLIEGDPLGIVTKSDLVKIYADNFQNLNSINKYMKKIVYTVLPNHSVHRALAIMLKKGVSRTIVSKNGKPVGVITRRDLMPITSFINDSSVASETLFGIGHILLAKNIMKPPITIRVVNSDEHLVGIITKTDIVRAIKDMRE